MCLWFVYLFIPVYIYISFFSFSSFNIFIQKNIYIYTYIHTLIKKVWQKRIGFKRTFDWKLNFQCDFISQGCTHDFAAKKGWIWNMVKSWRLKRLNVFFFSFTFKTHFLVCISTMDNFHFKQLVSKVNDSIDEFSLIIYIVYAINITINIGNVCINRYILLSIIIVISFVSKVRYAFRNIILII